MTLPTFLVRPDAISQQRERFPEPIPRHLEGRARPIHELKRVHEGCHQLERLGLRQANLVGSFEEARHESPTADRFVEVRGDLAVALFGRVLVDERGPR